MGKNKHKKVEVKSTTTTPPPAKAEDTTPYRSKAGLTTLFCYGTLNVHDVQRSVWGEAKEGSDGILLDYELKLWGGSAIMYVEKKIGESVVGKAYDLTKEQLEATDKFETEMYKRETVYVAGKGSFDVYVRNPEYSKDTRVILN